ncbi:hypothetical protein [Pseudomonas sp. QD4]|uniref:hypothetical protein n=1 Tax=Pseudomonas sp. QD4 TaxID=3368618 RepID=UPI003B9E280C
MDNADIAERLRLGGDVVELATATFSAEKLIVKLRLRKELVTLLESTCAQNYLEQICNDFVHRSQPFDHTKFNALCNSIAQSTDEMLYDVFGQYLVDHAQRY